MRRGLPGAAPISLRSAATSPAGARSESAFSSWWPWLILAAIAAIFVVLSGYLWDFTLDDSYISYRFAENLAEGLGFRWNPTDARPVEGFTSFLWVVLLAGLHLAGLDTLSAAKALGVLATLATFAILFVHGRPRTTPWVALFPVAALATHPYVLVHAVAGMETALYMLALTAQAALAVLSTARVRYERGYLASILVTFMVRPESLVFSALLLAGYVIVSQDRRGQVLRRALLYAVLPGALYWAVKSLYFGHLVPTPFQMKQGLSLIGVLASESGLTYVVNFFSLSVLGGAVFVAASWLTGIRTRPIYMAVFGAVGGQLLYFTTINPTVGLADRFLVPFLPPFLLVVSEQLRVLLIRRPWRVEEPAGQRRGIGGKLAVGGLALLLLFSVDAGNRHRQYTGLEDYFAVRLVNPAVGVALSGIGNDPQRVVLATGEAGAIPYTTGFYHIDLLGLTTESIGYGGFDLDTVYAGQPDIIFTHGVSFAVDQEGRVVADAQEAARVLGMGGPRVSRYEIGTGYVSYRVMLDERFQDYRLARRFEVKDEGGGVRWAVFVRRDSPYYDKVLERVRTVDLEGVLRDYRARHSVRGFVRFLQFWRG